jgi:hypothetical protein
MHEDMTCLPKMSQNHVCPHPHELASIERTQKTMLRLSKEKNQLKAFSCYFRIGISFILQIILIFHQN